jgi:TRAP-type C4-dicarboxylate transport system permease small subunit
MQNLTGRAKNIDALFGALLRGVSIGCLVVISVLMLINVFLRFLPVVSLSWFDEVLEGFFAWMVFFGAAALWRENEHFAVTFLPDWLRGSKKGYFLEVSVHLLSILFLVVFTYYSLNLTLRAGDTTPILMMPKRLLYLCMPLSGAIMIGYSLRSAVSSFFHLYKSLRTS